MNASTASFTPHHDELPGSLTSPQRISVTNGERFCFLKRFVRRVGDLNPQVPSDTVDYKSTPLPIRVNPPLHKWGTGSVLSDFSLATAGRSRNHELPAPSNHVRAWGDPTRTGIPRLNRRVLYQLSYAPGPHTVNTLQLELAIAEEIL